MNDKPLVNFLFDVYVLGEFKGQTTTEQRHEFIKAFRQNNPGVNVFDFEFRVVKEI